MNKIRVNYEGLISVADEVSRYASLAEDIAADIGKAISDMPVSCKLIYALKTTSYKFELKSVSSELARLNKGVKKAAYIYDICENQIMNAFADEQSIKDLLSQHTVQSTDSKWNQWPYNVLDNLLDKLGINEYGRDYQDPGEQRQQAQDELMSRQLSDIFADERYNKEAWENASLEEKERMLNEILDQMNEIYGTNITKDINYFNEGYDKNGLLTLGYYQDGRKQVSINTYILTDPQFSYETIMNTLVHEMRHAYQHRVTNDPGSYVVSENNAKSWDNNFDNYLDSDTYGFDAYQAQPVEQDARDFADSVKYS